MTLRYKLFQIPGTIEEYREQLRDKKVFKVNINAKCVPRESALDKFLDYFGPDLDGLGFHDLVDYLCETNRYDISSPCVAIAEAHATNMKPFLISRHKSGRSRTHREFSANVLKVQCLAAYDAIEFAERLGGGIPTTIFLPAVYGITKDGGTVDQAKRDLEILLHEFDNSRPWLYT